MKNLISLFSCWPFIDTTGFSWERLRYILEYHKTEPLIFSSGFFFFLFIAFLVLYIPIRKNRWGRMLYVTLFSLYFYYKSSGDYFVVILCTATFDYLIGQALYRAVGQTTRKLLVALSLCLNLGILGYFKYTNFLYELFVNIGNEIGYLFSNTAMQSLQYKPLDIFLPVGISFFTFQSLSYIIDIYRRQIKPVNHWLDYAFYVTFFPQLVAGPIVRAKDFIPQMYKIPTVNRSQFGEGLFLVLCGLFKKAVISDYISSNFVDRIFDAPLLYTGLENLLGIYGYALQIYCDFSGYSDMAIGIALLLGFRFNINFDSPYQSATITEFWRRWHISLSSWLKDYLYISLGGNRKGKVRTYINLAITMLLGGLWHGAALKFILWGGIHGVALAAHKFLMGRFSFLKPLGSQMNVLSRIGGIFITFHLVCFSWIFFRAANMEIAGQMLSQIVTNFHLEILPQFIMGYKGVFAMMVLGYILHFMPKRTENMLQGFVTRSPLVVQSLILCLLIFIIIQIKSAGIQAFIYFQF